MTNSTKTVPLDKRLKAGSLYEVKRGLGAAILDYSWNAERNRLAETFGSDRWQNLELGEVFLCVGFAPKCPTDPTSGNAYIVLYKEKTWLLYDGYTTPWHVKEVNGHATK